jgi:hypothetical protein
MSRPIGFILVFGLLIFMSPNSFSTGFKDSTVVEVKQVSKLIKSLKKKLEPEKYYLFGEHFDKKDISFSYPYKIFMDKPFDIEIIWKGRLIATYEVDSRTYKLTARVTDLR